MIENRSSQDGIAQQGSATGQKSTRIPGSNLSQDDRRRGGMHSAGMQTRDKHGQFAGRVDSARNGQRQDNSSNGAPGRQMEQAKQDRGAMGSGTNTQLNSQSNYQSNSQSNSGANQNASA